MSDVVTWRELVEQAGSPRRARTLARDEYDRVLRGTYLPRGTELTPELRCQALARALPEGVALAGRTALWAVGVDVLPPTEVLDVVTGRGTHLLRRPGVRPRTALVDDHDLVDLPNGSVALSAARAVADVARREELVEAVAVGDAVLRAGAATQEQLADAVDRAAALRGVVQARAVLSHLEPRSESQGETRLRMRLVLGGVPRPEAQVDYYDAVGRHVGRVDLVLGGALLEYDGREQRLREEVFGRDRRRQNRFLDLGGELRRYTADDVRPAAAGALCDEVRAAARATPSVDPRLHRGPDTLRPPRLHPLPTRAQLRARRAA